KDNIYRYAIDDIFKEFSQEEFNSSKYALDGGKFVNYRVTENEERNRIMVLERDGMMSIYKNSEDFDFRTATPFLVKDYVTNETWTFDESGYLTSGNNNINADSLSEVSHPDVVTDIPSHTEIITNNTTTSQVIKELSQNVSETRNQLSSLPSLQGL